VRKIILTAAIAMAVSGSAFAAGHGAKPLGIIIPPLASPQVHANGIIIPPLASPQVHANGIIIPPLASPQVHTNGIIIPPATATVKPAW
jgi:hypothetical protein